MKPGHEIKTLQSGTLNSVSRSKQERMLSGEAVREQGRWCVVLTCGVPGSHGDTHPHPQIHNIIPSMEHKSGIWKDREKVEYKMWNIICNVDNII